ncbi:MAG: Tfp pilus assembly protein FimT/FimU [Vicinamibacterales bacterium]
MAATSCIELLFAVGVAATLGAGATPGLLTAADEIRAGGAARLVAARLQQVRLRAISHARDTAVRFTQTPAGFAMTVYEDGNGNGVLSADIASGLDRSVGPVEHLHDSFPGVEFGALPGIPGADGSTPPGNDPVRLGSSDGVTFTPAGTATPGSLYIRGRGTAQYVVRILGETGRTRILKYSVRTRAWLAP